MDNHRIMRLIFSYILLFFTFIVSGQRIQNFNLVEANGNVAVKFSVGKGSQCSGFSIFHSLDSVNYTLIYHYPGICGDVGVTQDYSYTHSSPVGNSNNFYKIELVNTETSPAQKIFVPVPPDEQIIVYPIPVNSVTEKLNVKVRTNAALRGFIYNPFGVPVKPLSLSVNSFKTEITLDELNSGLYFIRLSDGKQNFSTSFIITR